jgi:hypothetical protein
VRTTLSLDDDVAHMLAREIRRSGVSFKEGVNHYLRLGLIAAKQPVKKKFRVTPRALGLPPGLSYDNVEELLESLEGGTHP